MKGHGCRGWDLAFPDLPRKSGETSPPSEPREPSARVTMGRERRVGSPVCGATGGPTLSPPSSQMSLWLAETLRGECGYGGVAGRGRWRRVVIVVVMAGASRLFMWDADEDGYFFFKVVRSREGMHGVSEASYTPLGVTMTGRTE
jgi:hypothetical protein